MDETHFEIERIEVRPISRKLRTNWRLKFINDMKFLIDEDAYSLMADEIAMGIDKEILETLKREAVKENNLYERFKFKEEDFVL